MRNLEGIFKHDFKGYPNNINCDNEFNKHDINEWAQEHDIKMWFSDPDEINKNAIIERFNRTLAMKLQRWRLATGRKNWEKVLGDIIDGYNDTEHRTTQHKPIDIFKHNIPNEQDIINIDTKLKVGDKVRTKKHKKVFDKGDEIKYSNEIYVIIEIKKNKYKLENMKTKEPIKKLYKEYELKKISEIIERKQDTTHILRDLIENKIKRRRKRLLIKDLGPEPVEIPKNNLRKAKKLREVEIDENGDEIIPETKKKKSNKTGDEPEYIIEKIIGKKKVSNRIYYNVKWEGYDEPTYEPRTKLIEDGAKNLIDEYEQSIKSKK